MDGIGGRCGDIMKHLREFAKAYFGSTFHDTLDYFTFELWQLVPREAFVNLGIVCLKVLQGTCFHCG